MLASRGPDEVMDAAESFCMFRGRGGSALG